MAWFGVVYALLCYLLFAASTVWAIAFLVNAPVLPTTIDRGTLAPAAQAVAVDLGLFALFGLQHSVMARAGFKRRWTRLVPPPVERATYVLASSAALALLLRQWHPLPEPVLWTAASPAARAALHAVGGAGWALLGASSLMLDHVALFGLRQPWEHLRGINRPPPQFRTPMLYQQVRHPIYLGFLLAFWGTPDMTAGHLLFAGAGTAYILIGVAFEERDLLREFGPRYRDYQRQVGMLLPRWRSLRRGGARDAD
ncbi:MAG: isoprenylcysteine carboxylmethyltransferase family protein [Burkholderiales bacterium]|nr:MAG: isoprenylcysteine carboxylmethyltransferase family protein [Burkholderiales bacterium]